MEKLTSFQRSYLRGLANTLKPDVFIGKSGLTDSVVAAINDALDANELIKVRFLEFKEEKKDLAMQIQERCRCFCVGITGFVAIFYRPQADPEKRRIQVPLSRSDVQ